MPTTKRKRNALIISYIWPPMEGVGLVRAMKFAKYLPENGWEPIVLTVRSDALSYSAQPGPPGSVKVYRTEYRDIIDEMKRFFSIGRLECKRCEGGETVSGMGRIGRRRPPSFIREMISMPDDQIGWYKFAINEGCKIIEKEHIDLIISTSPPETAHLIARRLKKDYNIPWVADLRDLWAEDHFRERSFMKRLILKRMEKNILRDADRVITVSEPWALSLKRSLRSGKDRVSVIENGFDEEDFNKDLYAHNDKFVISYTGKLHGEKQPVGIIFKVIKDLTEKKRVDRNKIEVRFYVMGYDKPDIAAMALSYGLSDVIIELCKVDYYKSLEIQGRSDALLFVQWHGRGSEGWYSAKLYDYLGARRPIMAIAQETGIVADLIAKTSSGIIAYDELSLREAVLKLYDEYMKDGRVSFYGNEPEIARYSRRERTKELGALLDMALAENVSRTNT